MHDSKFGPRPGVARSNRRSSRAKLAGRQLSKRCGLLEASRQATAAERSEVSDERMRSSASASTRARVRDEVSPSVRPTSTTRASMHEWLLVRAQRELQSSSSLVSRLRSTCKDARDPRSLDRMSNAGCTMLPCVHPQRLLVSRGRKQRFCLRNRLRSALASNNSHARRAASYLPLRERLREGAKGSEFKIRCSKRASRAVKKPSNKGKAKL